MAKKLQLRRGTTSQHSSFTGDVGECTVDTDKDTIVVHDNSTAGGRPLAREDLNNVSSATIVSNIDDDAITYAKMQDVATANRVLGSTSAGGTISEVQVSTAMLATDAVDGTKIADDSINSEHYVDGSIDTVHIADAQITTAKLADVNVTTAKLANDAVTSPKIADDSIGNQHIAGNAVQTAQINNDAVTGAKIADNAINSEHYVDLSIDTAHIADNQITTAKLVNGSVSQPKILDGAVTNTKLGADAVTGAKIADDAVDSEHTANGAVDLAHMSANSVDSDQYVDGSIDAAHLADSAVTEPKLATDAAGSTGQFLQKSGSTTMTWATVSTQAFPSGTVMLFRQTSAPTGWTKDTSNNNNSAIRVVTGSISTGGSDNFTSVFGASKTTASHTLTTNEMPSHNHSITGSGAFGPNFTKTGGSQSHSTGNTGGGSGHHHNLTDLDLKFIDVIVATHD